MTIRKTLLIASGEALLRRALAEQLARHGEFHILHAATVEEAKACAKDAACDLILQDGNLPGMTPREACKTLRDGGFDGPIILVAGTEARDDDLTQAGASDIVTRPFRFSSLLARIHAHLHPQDQSRKATFRIGPYMFLPAEGLLLDDAGREIRLTEKEVAILEYLRRAGGRPVAREVLLTEVWGYNSGVTTHTVETHIYRLRRKLEPDPANARLLLTDAGGYALACDDAATDMEPNRET